jgi:hypothetical protein
MAHAAASDVSGARNRRPLRCVRAFDRHDTTSLRGRLGDPQWGLRTMAVDVERLVERGTSGRYPRGMFKRGRKPAQSSADAERQALFEKLAQRPETVCPFLGLAGARADYEEQATDEHRCFAFGAPEPVSGEQQRNVCLQRGYANCPRYLRGVPSFRPTSSRPCAGRRRRSRPRRPRSRPRRPATAAGTGAASSSCSSCSCSSAGERAPGTSSPDQAGRPPTRPRHPSPRSRWRPVPFRR